MVFLRLRWIFGVSDLLIVQYLIHKKLVFLSIEYRYALSVDK